MVTPDTGIVDGWAEAVLARHTRALARPEFLKAARALSVRYVERRSDLPRRSPIDSAGKRAAFAGLFAPLHFYTALGIAERLGIGDSGPIDRVVDLGCGTGVSSAACAVALDRAPGIEGVDQLGWSLAEAVWNWRALGVRGRTRRGDLVTAAERLAAQRNIGHGRTLVVLGWTVNELGSAGRARLLCAVRSLAADGTPALVIEPIGRGATPWWREWHDALLPHHVREDAWSIEPRLPAAVCEVDAAAGFRREALTAKSLYVPAAAGSEPDPSPLKVGPGRA